jgi:hypothetical protein
MSRTILGRTLQVAGIAVLGWGLARLVFGIAIDLPFLPSIPLGFFSAWPALGIGLGSLIGSAAIEHRASLRLAAGSAKKFANEDSSRRLGK